MAPPAVRTYPAPLSLSGDSDCSSPPPLSFLSDDDQAIGTGHPNEWNSKDTVYLHCSFVVTAGRNLHMLPHVIAWIQKFDRENEGQGLVEYALIIVLVSIAAIVTLGALGTRVS